MIHRHTTAIVRSLLVSGTIGWTFLACSGAAASALVPPGASWHALRFFGTGGGEQDRVRIKVTDGVPGSSGTTPSDVGAGSFTIEFWIRGTMAENPQRGLGGGVEVVGSAWRNGHLLVDRGIWGDSDREWGISIAGGRVRFGTGRDTTQGNGDVKSTIEGTTVVLDGTWRHVACVRDADSGRKRIFVDGVLDFETVSLLSFDDLSYPPGGVPNSMSPWNPYLVLGAAKPHGGQGAASFSGWFDEFRLWNVARTAAEIGSSFDVVVEPDEPGLVGMYRFEEGAGTVVVDSSAAGSPDGTLVAGVAGNGEWVSAWRDPVLTAPVRLQPEDLNGDGIVDAADLGILLESWGSCPEDEACSADLNGDGVVDGADLGQLLAAWN